MIAITGATGQLGRLVIEQLLKTVPANQIVAIVRNPAKAEALSQQGIVVRQGDYTDQAALTTALKGVEKLLLISSSEVGQRATQHQNVDHTPYEGFECHGRAHLVYVNGDLAARDGEPTGAMPGRYVAR